MFTYFVLQGLKGAARTKRHDQISVGDLFDYVREHVAEETHGAQNPQALAGSERGFLLTGQSKMAASNSKGADSFAGGQP